MSIDLANADLTTTANLIRSKQVSAVEVVKHCLGRIDRWQPRINAFIDVEHEQALDAALQLDQKLARGEAVGPLHGVPMAHKDMFYRNGRICSCGSAIRREWRATSDATVVTRLAAAGSVTVGRLNMSEFAAHPTGDNQFYGACLNPWNTEFVTGGSSSGSGAAVAARLVYASLGSVTGGSIRIPASFNGVTGLMPTYGRVSRHGAMPRGWSLDHIGPLARSAADCALMLEVIAGYDANDGSSSQQTVPTYASTLRAGIRGSRIGVLELPKDVVLPPSIAQAMQASREVLESLGAIIVPVTSSDLSAYYQFCEIIVRTEAATVHAAWLKERPQDYSDYMRARIEGGFAIPATWYAQALAQRGPALAQFLETVMSKCDVLHLPTTPLLVPTVASTQSSDTNPSALANLGGMAVLTRPFNYLGLPTMSVPCGFDEHGLPIAFQLVARPFDESALLRTAHAYQGVTDWHTRAPMLAG